MWNFLVSGLSVGCTLVLYDGSPLYDPAYLWRLTDELGITIFGTSAKYIDQLAVGVPTVPVRLLDTPNPNGVFSYTPRRAACSVRFTESVQASRAPQFVDAAAYILHRVTACAPPVRLRLRAH